MAQKHIVTFVLLLLIQSAISDLSPDTESKYDLHLSEIPMNIKDANLDSISVYSKFGQEFSCSIPQHNSEYPENEIPPVNNTHIASLLSTLNSSECLSLQKGWWTYELCYQKYILQFHGHDNGRQSLANLGNYESDFDWDQPNSNKSELAYHSQYYANGSLCDITGKLRRSEVQYVCTNSKHAQLISVDEPETCVYVLRVSVPSMCQHPTFAPPKPQEPLKIHCQPVLTDEEFQKYQKFHSEKKLPDKTNKSPTIKPPTISNSSRVYSPQWVHQRLIKSRNRSILRRIKKLTRSFLDYLNILSMQYKQSNGLLPIQWLKHYNIIGHNQIVRLPLVIDYDYVSNKLPASWSSFADLKKEIFNWTTKRFRASINAERAGTTSKSFNVMILLGKTLTSHLELITNSLNRKPNNLGTIKLLVTTNFTDLFHTLGQLSNILIKIQDPDLIRQVKTEVLNIYERRNLDLTTGLPQKISVSSHLDSFETLYEPHFDAIELNPEDQLKTIDRMKGLIQMMTASLKIRIIQMTLIQNYLEQKATQVKMAEHLGSTILSALGRLDFKVLMVHDINHSYESIGAKTKGKKRTTKAQAGKESESSDPSAFQPGDVIKIIQKAIQSLEPKNSEEFEVYENPNGPSGMATYYIMPSGRKRREEKRLKQLQTSYNFDWKSKSDQSSSDNN